MDPANEPKEAAGQDFAAALSDFRHCLFNSLGVMMALAEMAKRDPGKYPRLAEVVLEKSEELRARMLGLSASFESFRAG